MALTIKGLSRLNLNIASNILFKNTILNAGARFVYSDSCLGIPSYEHSRLVYRNQFVTIENAFRTKMKELCTTKDGIVFSEDLKAILHLINKNEEDLSLIASLIEKYIESERTVQFGSYKFGPVVMRMFYHLNEPQQALNLYKSCLNTNFFDQRTAIHILLTLMFKNEMYCDMRKLYNEIYEVKPHLTSSLTFLLTAGCCKENTKEALDDALRHWKRMFQEDIRPSARSTSLLTYLALKQNSVPLALELAVTLNRPNFINVRCLKVLCYLYLKKYVQIIPILKGVLDNEAEKRKSTFFQDVLDEVENTVQQNMDIEGASVVLELIEELRRKNCVTSNYTLEQHLLKPSTILFRKSTTIETADPFKVSQRQPFREERRRFNFKM